MITWEPGSRDSANECPCEPLEEHVRPCQVKGPCFTCERAAGCASVCPACRRYLSLLEILQERSFGAPADPGAGSGGWR